MKKLYILLCVINLFSTIYTNEKIKMYAIYTPSHKVLVDQFFKPTLTDPDIELILIEIPEQTCESAQFMDVGWTKTTIKKIELVLEAIDQNWGAFFILSDVDIQFFGSFAAKIKQLMKDYDFLIQKDNPKGTLCSGFFVCRANEKTKQLFIDVLTYMKNNQEISDQRALNRHLSRNQDSNQYGIIWDYLPTKYFFGGGTFTGIYWKDGVKMYVPKKPLMHHANWVAGISGKIKQLQYVRDIVNNN